MKLAQKIQDLFPQLSVYQNKSLAEYTTFRLGGPCPLLIDNPSEKMLPLLVHFLHKENRSFVVIGQGSNLVISDRGLDCIVIRFCSDQPKIEANGCRVTVSGNTLLNDLVYFSVENGIGDFSYCSGIPGTVGGGIAGNAGAWGRQVGDYLVQAEILELNGIVRVATQDDLQFSYRHSRLRESKELILSATFDLPKAGIDVLRTERNRIMQFRKAHHPDWRQMPCAGSVFRNIESSSSVERRKAAGFFLQKAGAHLLRVGGAHPYEKHANIIIAEAGCSAQNVRILSEQMKQSVKKMFNLDLICEIRFLGDF